MDLKAADIAFFETNGYLVVEGLLSPSEVAAYREIYDDFISGKVDCGANRSDLGVGLGDGAGQVENITQIMWPSDFVAGLTEMKYHRSALGLARGLLGPDLEMDFDMLINKAPGTATPTPWHQDAAYWVSMPDTRAVSCWLALDEANLENGCMWYVPGSHLGPIRPHRFAGAAGGALTCDCSEKEGVPVPVQPGTAILHHGATLHYSRGNSTGGDRRAFIVNFRPAAMIEHERAQGFDHGRTPGTASDRKARNDDSR